MITLEQRKVSGVVAEAARALEGKEFNHGEVVIGLAELIGRTVVDCTDNTLQARELVQAIVNHMTRTIAIGSQVKGKNIIEV